MVINLIRICVAFLPQRVTRSLIHSFGVASGVGPAKWKRFAIFPASPPRGSVLVPPADLDENRGPLHHGTQHELCLLDRDPQRQGQHVPGEPGVGDEQTGPEFDDSTSGCVDIVSASEGCLLLWHTPALLSVCSCEICMASAPS